MFFSYLYSHGLHQYFTYKKKINENKIEVNTTNWIWFELQGILLFNSNSMEGL